MDIYEYLQYKCGLVYISDLTMQKNKEIVVHKLLKLPQEQFSLMSYIDLINYVFKTNVNFETFEELKAYIKRENYAII